MKLRCALTREDFESIQGSLVANWPIEVNPRIKTVEVLKCFLEKYCHQGEKFLLEMCCNIVWERRVDMLECFLPYIELTSLFDLPEFSRALLSNVVYGACDVITFFLDRGLDVNFGDTSDGQTMLANTLHNRNNISLIDLLLERGANPNCKHYFGETGVHLAIQSGDVSILDRLIVHGVNLRVGKDSFGRGLWEELFSKSFLHPEEIISFTRRLIDMQVPITNEEMKLAAECYASKKLTRSDLFRIIAIFSSLKDDSRKEAIVYLGLTALTIEQ